jgi:hypothetical protein
MASRREQTPGQEGRSAGGQKGGEASLHSPNVSASEIQVFLKGINYPVDKEKLVQTAKTNGATKNVMDFINRMPEQEYSSPIDVGKAFSELK